MNLEKIQVSGLAPSILVYDMRTSFDFYCGILGFRLMAGSDADNPGWALLRLGNAELMMEPIYPRSKRPTVPDALRTQYHGDTVFYFGCANIDEAYEHLQQNCIKVDPPRVESYGMKQLYVTDPDGYKLCFQYPHSDEMFEAWKNWYGSDFKKTS